MKMKYFREKINLTQGWKRKAQTELEGVYKEFQGERRKKQFLHRANLALRVI